MKCSSRFAATFLALSKLAPTVLIFLVGGGVSALCHDESLQPIPSVLELPDLDMTPEEIKEEFDSVTVELEAELESIIVLSKNGTANRPTTFQETILAGLARVITLIDECRGRLAIFAFASDEVVVRNAAQTAADWTLKNILQNHDLYLALKTFQESDYVDEFVTTQGRRRLLSKYMTSFEQEGMTLDEDSRREIFRRKQELALVENRLLSNANADLGTILLTNSELEGLSEAQLAQYPYNATIDAYTVQCGLFSEYSVIVRYATLSATRKKVFLARASRAKVENAELIRLMVQLRQNISQSLGYETWADYKIADKMVGSRQGAVEFVDSLQLLVEDAFVDEKTILANLQNDMEGTDVHRADTIQDYDSGYLETILLEQEFSLDRELITHYFEEKHTIQKLFEIYEELFSIVITIEESPSGVWADDVQLVTITETDGLVIGAVYLDLHPRPGKYTHFAMFPLIQGHIRDADGQYQAPVAAILGNWPGPGDTSPSLWNLDGVTTMFHVFGHALHHTFACVEFAPLAGTNVPRDFVETPSMMLERWMDDKDVLRNLTRHFETGDTMPDEMLDSMLATKDLFPSHFIRFQSSLSQADLKIHSFQEASDIPGTGYEIYDATNLDFESYYHVLEGSALLASFTHLFGGYDAGYYGYLWSTAIAADLASEFRKAPGGFSDREVGRRYRKDILEPGDSRHPSELIQSFLGREWEIDAYVAEIFRESSNLSATPSGSPTRETFHGDVDGDGVPADDDSSSLRQHTGVLSILFLGLFLLTPQSS